MLLRNARNALGSCGAYARTSSGLRFCSVLVGAARRDDAHQLALLLKQSASEKNLHDGRLLHFLLADYQLDRSVLYGNRLMCIYAKCGASCDACAFFDSMHQTDSHSWRFLMKACISDAKESKQIFQQMMMEGMLPVKATFISVLSACLDGASLVDGIQIHASIERTEFISDMEVGNTLINMYYKCKRLTLAVEFYDGMFSCNVVTFNILIGAFAEGDNIEEALKLFHQMELQAVTPSVVTFINMVSACTTVGSLADSKKMHARIVGSEFASDVVLMNAFLNMYGKCGDLKDAERLFLEMPRQDLATWNSLITSLIHHKREKDALQNFQHMHFMGPFPNNVTVLNTLAACGCEEDLARVKQLHLKVVGKKSETDIILGTALVNAYAKCGDLENAVKIFTNMSSWDVILWNAVITAYVNHGQNKEAIELFQIMQVKGWFPNKVTIIVVLDAFMVLEEGKKIHEFISQHGFEKDLAVGTGLINMYNRCCSLNDVHIVFDNMAEHDLVSWNAFLWAVAQLDSNKEVFCRFQMMLFEGVFPDNITFTCLFDACKNIIANSKEGLWIHACFIASNLRKDVHDTNSIIIMYSNSGHVKHARRVFEESEDRDEITWNALIAAYSQGRRYTEALFLFKQMQAEGLLRGSYTLINLISGFANAVSVLEGMRVHASITGSQFEENTGVKNSLLNMYVKWGKREDGRRLFDASLSKDIVTWNAMLSTYAQCEEADEAFLILQRMLLECLMPDKVTLTCMVSACTSQALVAEGKQIHVRILENDSKCDATLMNALITMYGKSGGLEDASKVFKDMHSCNVVSWSAIIAAYALHGRGKEALQLYSKMQQGSLVPNKITYLILLCACSHSGLLKEGLECFISMIQGSGVKPTQKHINTIVDLLGRAGLLDAAESITIMQPTSFSWITLLNICRMHCDMDRGERVGKHALVLEPDNGALYVLLSNLCALQGKI